MFDMDDVLTSGNFSKILEEFLGYIPDYESKRGIYHVQDILGDKKSSSSTDSKIWTCTYYRIYICTDYMWKEIGTILLSESIVSQFKMYCFF